MWGLVVVMDTTVGEYVVWVELSRLLEFDAWVNPAYNCQV